MPGRRTSGYGFLLILIVLIITDIVIVFDVPVLRQVLGLLLICIVPGLLILFLLKLNRLGTAEKIVLTIGVSTAFAIFFGWILSQVSLLLGYTRPLATYTLVLSLSGVLVVLAIGAYIRNREAFSAFPFRLELNTEAKLCLLLPVAFPLLSILGTHYLNISNNNIILLTLLFLIPVSIIFITILSGKISKDTYPIAIIMIGASLMIMYSLRSAHIVGHDVHSEYYLFHMTLVNSHWSILEGSSLDSCLSISVLPAMFQSLLHLNGEESLFMGVYALICTFVPLSVYVISKKYIGEQYAFLAAFFFISQPAFLIGPGSPRTNLALFFFALCIMVLFHSEITRMNGKVLFILFVAATIASHYSTTYIFLFLLLFTFLLSLIFKKYCLLKNITFTGIALFVVLIFLWYDQLTQAPFVTGVHFISETIRNLELFFVEGVRSQEVGLLLGWGMTGEPFLRWIHWVITWLSLAFIAVGITGTLIKRKDMILTPGCGSSSAGFLRSRFETEYFLMSIVGIVILVATIALPYASTEYDIFRVYSQMAVFLSIFLVVGGIILSKSLRVNRYFFILLVLIPYFLFTTWAAYEASGVHASHILSSEAPSSRYEFVYDQEIPSAVWLKGHMEENPTIYAADRHGARKLISQGKISPSLINESDFSQHVKTDGYIYLDHNNVVDNRLVIRQELYDMSEYSDMISGKNKLYTNGGSEIYK